MLGVGEGSCGLSVLDSGGVDVSAGVAVACAEEVGVTDNPHPDRETVRRMAESRKKMGLNLMFLVRSAHVVAGGIKGDSPMSRCARMAHSSGCMDG